MANTDAGSCGECGRPLPAQASRGRRREYCDATCRSAARRRRTPAPPALCELRVGGHECGELAAGRVRAGLDVPVHACAGHRDVALALLAGRYPNATWRRYVEPGRPERGVLHDQADVDAAGPRDGYGYALLYSAVDGWELYAGDDEFVASHDGIDAGDVAGAQAWAAQLLVDERGLRVGDWRARPSRRDSVAAEYVAGVVRPAAG